MRKKQKTCKNAKKNENAKINVYAKTEMIYIMKSEFKDVSITIINCNRYM